MSALSPANKKKRPQATPPAWLADIGLIRPAAVTFGAVLLAALVVVGASHWWLQSELDSEVAARQARDAAFQRYTDIANEGLQMRQYSAAYEQLVARGLFGADKRLDWIDALKQSQARHLLAPIAYSIEAEQPLQMEGNVSGADYQLRASKMTLHLDLLHEMDLLNLLQDLRHAGLLSAQQCTLQRGAQAAQADQPGQAGHFTGDCSLTWLTLSLPAAGAAAPPAAAAARRSAP